MQVDVVSAAVAGVVAAQVMEIPAYLQKALRRPLRQDVFAEAGTLVGARGRARRPIGYVGHAVLAILIAQLYAAFFALVGGEHLLAWGVLGGLVHFLVGGLVVAVAFPVVDPASRDAALRRVGFAYRRYGRRDVTTFLGGHLVFGLLVGLIYAALAGGSAL